MSKPAARVLDNHVCPLVGPTGVPHAGGVILPPGKPSVLIGGLPAATAGDNATCVGDLNTIAMGSASVLIGGKPAARMGDQMAHGGVIVSGEFTVLIG